jgi:hypothetical protein
MAELNLWFLALKPFGLIFLHGAATFEEGELG